MKRIILVQGNKDILGSDGLMYIDGRFSINTTINEVKKRNNRYVTNFPHKVATGFYFAGEHLKQISKIITL